jgi:hypothetical protein
MDQDKTKSCVVKDVRTILVVMSSFAVAFDRDAMVQKLLLVYPDSAVFFKTTSGKAIGSACPEKVDLLVDLTGPGQRQGWFYSKKLRRMARFAVGRNAGLFRKKIYNKVFNEKQNGLPLPRELVLKEHFVQNKVFELVGVSMASSANVTLDRSKSVALSLPPLKES